MRKLLPIFIVFAGFLFSFHVTAQVNFGTSENGLYGRGSDISVPIVVPTATSCFTAANKFELFISDATGNFGNERKIGESSGFFSTHVNGRIPNDLNAGTGYKLRVKTTSPATVSVYNGSINITTANSQQVEVTPSVPNQILEPGVYGWCGSGVGDNKSIILRQGSATTTAERLVLRNEQTGVTQTFTPTVVGFSLTGLAMGYYTATAISEKMIGTELVISTRTYLLMNVPSKVNIQSGGTPFGCIDPVAGTGADISYTVNTTDDSGIKNNYPGSIYRITWGDGGEDVYTHCELMANGGALNHNYKKTSCGEPPINIGNGTTITNSFKVSVTTINPFCQADPISATTYPKIFSKPVAQIDPATSTAACINTPITFSNSSTLGNNANCSLTMQWSWYVDGVLVSNDEVYVHPGFTTPGIHIVKLVASNDVTICAPSEDVRSICIQNPPQPSFNFNGNPDITSCAPALIKPTNTSIIDDNCNANNTYKWTVTGGAFTYANGTNENSPEPEFNFTAAGTYKITLSINTASCGVVTTAEQTVNINEIPVANLSPNTTACNLTAYEFSPGTSGPTKTELTGTGNPEADTYTWTVTGGAFAFTNGSNLNSQYPTIDFQEYKTYTITVTHKNNCGASADTQIITFKPSPVVNPGTYTPICFDGTVSLQGTITGTVDSFEWVGGAGTFSPNRQTLNAVYTPTLAERQAGKVELTLKALTPLAPPCNIIEGFVTINIKAENTITSAASKEICTASAVDYTPEASIAGSTFSWTAINPVNVTGFSATGSGTSITDVLTNTSATTAGTITYRIVPFFDGCSGTPFDLKVTVNPKPVNTISTTVTTACSGQTVLISGNLPTGGNGTFTYYWEQSANNGATWSTIAGETSKDLNFTLTSRLSFRRVVESGGCSTVSSPVTIDVKPPISNNTITADQTICVGKLHAALAGSLPQGGDGVYSYQWESSIDNGSTWVVIVGATSMDYNPPLLSVTTAYRRQASSPTCTGNQQNTSNVVTITVNPNAVAEFTFTADRGCVPFNITSAVIKATDYPDRNGTYTWYVNGALLGTGIDFPGYIISTDDTNVQVRLVVTSSKGCLEAEMTHEFGTQKTVTASFTQNKTEGCGPLTVGFTNSSSAQSGVTFLWDFGNGQTSTDASPGPVTFLPDPTGKDKLYTVTLTATSNCGISTPFTSTVLVRTQPVSIFSPDKIIGCSPFVVNFSNTSPVASNTTYTFDFGDGSPVEVKNDRTSISHTFTTGTNNRTYTVKMTAKNDCGEHTSEHLITVTPNTAVAELVVNSTDIRGCAPFTVPFYNNSGGATSFVYDFGDGTSMSTYAAPERVTHTFQLPGVYTITLTASNGCSTSSTTETVTVLPQPEVSFRTDVSVGYPGLEVKFENTSIGGVRYLWNFGDGTTSTEENPVHKYSALGTYNVSLTTTNQNGCSDVKVNPFKVEGEPGFLYVPNSFMPSSNLPDVREFRAKGTGIQSWKLSIFDKWGKMIWSTTKLEQGKPAEGWDGTFAGTLLPQGIYFWKIDAQFINGSGWKGMTYDKSAPKRTGSIYLIR